MSASEHQRVDFAARWAEEHERFPGMARSTFVTNQMHGGGDLRDLAHWLLTQPDLHGVVFEGGAVGYTAESMNVTENADGTKSWQADPKKIHYRYKIALEIVVDGKSKLDSSSRYCWGDEA